MKMIFVVPFKNSRMENFFSRGWGRESFPESGLRVGMRFYLPSYGNSFSEYFIKIIFV
jgi:hypothetical protein